MKYIWIYTLLILNILCCAQNVAPNPSFETYTMCPNSNDQIEYAFPWNAATNASSTDYFNICSVNFNVPYSGGGFQFAHTGNAYSGLFIYHGSGQREYLQVQLTNTLVASKTYYVEFYANSHNGSWNSYCNNIAANLSVTRPYTSTFGVLQSLIPHIMLTGNPVINDTLNWVKISGCYTAQGGEQYLTIGNFFDNTNTVVTGTTGLAYYYIDDVLVEEITGQCVTGLNEYKKDEIVNVYPNPNNGNFNLAYKFVETGNELIVYDLMGKEIKRTVLENNEGIKTINGTEFNNGIYFYKIINIRGELMHTGKLIISK